MSSAAKLWSYVSWKARRKLRTCVCARYVDARKRTFDWLGNWLDFDISSFQKTENVCGVCICAYMYVYVVYVYDRPSLCLSVMHRFAMRVWALMISRSHSRLYWCPEWGYTVKRVNPIFSLCYTLCRVWFRTNTYDYIF